MTVQHNERFRRQRKMMLVLPLIVGPILCLIFYSLGGGRGKVGNALARSGKGLNMTLPSAKLDSRNKVRDKLGFYKQADQDSLRLMENRKQDPFYRGEFSTPPTKGVVAGGMQDSLLNIGGTVRPRMDIPGFGSRTGQVDGQAGELLKKLELLKTALNNPAAGRDSGSRAPALVLERRFGGAAGYIAKRDGEAVSGVGPVDPELDQLSGMLDKILRIQHPEENRSGDTAEGRDRSVPVGLLKKEVNEEVVKTIVDSANMLAHRGEKPGPGGKSEVEEQAPGTGFIDLEEGSQSDAVGEELFEATVTRDQTLVAGESVELRLSQDAVINFGRIMKGTLLSGRTSLSGERLLVTVNSIRVGNITLPVSLEVLDMDGMTGIREPGSINREVAKESAGEAVSGVGLTAVDPGLGAQAMSAGLQAAKSLVNRKVKLVRVSLKAGYRVLLRNTKVNR